MGLWHCFYSYLHSQYVPETCKQIMEEAVKTLVNVQLGVRTNHS
jgi:hypothetical protein